MPEKKTINQVRPSSDRDGQGRFTGLSDTGNKNDGNPSAAKSANRTGTSTRGFAAMSGDAQREIARKGGVAVSKDRQHMAEIGRKGGESNRSNRG